MTKNAPAAILTVADLEVAGKRVLVRVDFNVPLADGRVSDDTRIRAALPTIDHLRRAGARVVLVSHLGRPNGRPNPAFSLRPVAARLRELAGGKAAFFPQVVGSAARAAAAALGPGEVLLMENLRFHAGEEANDPAFAKELAALGELFVSDAFGTVHRAHASTVGVAAHFRQAAAGFLIARELEYLGRALREPLSPYVAILGGAKVGDKMPVLRSLLVRADTLLIGGAMAYTFLRAQGHQVGASLVDEPHLGLAEELLAEAALQKKQVLLPEDHVTALRAAEGESATPCGLEIPPGRVGLDIGPATLRRFSEAIAGAAMVVWNGPMGMFELAPFREGTFAVARAVAASGAVSIVGGGDSVAAVNQAGVADHISHLSTGGGATLELLEGKSLPGLEVLTEKPVPA